MKHRVRWTAIAALAVFLSACQAPAAPPSSPVEPEAWPYTGLSPQGPFPADLHELDTVGFEAPVGAPLALPVTYRRGVEEQVSWDGTGQGTAELWNEHGQLIYRVREGEAPQTLTVGAGRHTLVITPDPDEPASAMLLLAAAGPEGAGLTREIVDLSEAGSSALPPRGEVDPCAVARGHMARVRSIQQDLADLEAQEDPDPRQEQALKRAYLFERLMLSDVERRHGERLFAECGLRP